VILFSGKAIRAFADLINENFVAAKRKFSYLPLEVCQVIATRPRLIFRNLFDFMQGGNDLSCANFLDAMTIPHLVSSGCSALDLSSCSLNGSVSMYVGI
jgi:hypothetical protein